MTPEHADAGAGTPAVSTATHRRIQSIAPAAGWYALYGSGADGYTRGPVVVWALMDDGVAVGMVTAGCDGLEAAEPDRAFVGYFAPGSRRCHCTELETVDGNWCCGCGGEIAQVPS